MLVSSELRSKRTKDKANTENGCGPCNKPRCSWCLLRKKTTAFKSTNQAVRTFDILHTLNCQSAFVIYIIECRMCKLQYVEKSETAFNLRLNNHRNHVKMVLPAANSQNTFYATPCRTHNFDWDTKTMIIKEIKWHEMHIERKGYTAQGK